MANIKEEKVYSKCTAYWEMHTHSMIFARPSKVSVRYLVILESRNGMWVFEKLNLEFTTD